MSKKNIINARFRNFSGGINVYDSPSEIDDNQFQYLDWFNFEWNKLVTSKWYETLYQYPWTIQTIQEDWNDVYVIANSTLYKNDTALHWDASKSYIAYPNYIEDSYTYFEDLSGQANWSNVNFTTSVDLSEYSTFDVRWVQTWTPNTIQSTFVTSFSGGSLTVDQAPPASTSVWLRASKKEYRVQVDETLAAWPVSQDEYSFSYSLDWVAEVLIDWVTAWRSDYYVKPWVWIAPWNTIVIPNENNRPSVDIQVKYYTNSQRNVSYEVTTPVWVASYSHIYDYEYNVIATGLSTNLDAIVWVSAEPIFYSPFWIDWPEISVTRLVLDTPWAVTWNTDTTVDALGLTWVDFTPDREYTILPTPNYIIVLNSRWPWGRILYYDIQASSLLEVPAINTFPLNATTWVYYNGQLFLSWGDTNIVQISAPESTANPEDLLKFNIDWVWAIPVWSKSNYIVNISTSEDWIYIFSNRETYKARNIQLVWTQTVFTPDKVANNWTISKDSVVWVEQELFYVDWVNRNIRRVRYEESFDTLRDDNISERVNNLLQTLPEQTTVYTRFSYPNVKFTFKQEGFDTIHNYTIIYNVREQSFTLEQDRFVTTSSGKYFSNNTTNKLFIDDTWLLRGGDAPECAALSKAFDYNWVFSQTGLVSDATDYKQVVEIDITWRYTLTPEAELIVYLEWIEVDRFDLTLNSESENLSNTLWNNSLGNSTLGTGWPVSLLEKKIFRRIYDLDLYWRDYAFWIEQKGAGELEIFEVQFKVRAKKARVPN